MKRSEMVLIITEAINDYEVGSQGNESCASHVLAAIEGCGMLPPSDGSSDVTEAKHRWREE